MANVEPALIRYFKRPKCCGDIPFNRTTNIYHACGFDVGGTTWRDIAYDINQLPDLIAANLCIDPSTKLDACTSIADIEGILVPRPAGAGVMAAKKIPKPKAKKKKPAAGKAAKTAKKAKKKAAKGKKKSRGIK